MSPLSKEVSWRCLYRRRCASVAVIIGGGSPPSLLPWRADTLVAVLTIEGVVASYRGWTHQRLCYHVIARVSGGRIPTRGVSLRRVRV